MTTDKHQLSLNLTIYNKPIKQVIEFNYLGPKMMSNGNQEAALKNRIGLGWAAFQKNNTVLKLKPISVVPISLKV